MVHILQCALLLLPTLNSVAAPILDVPPCSIRTLELITMYASYKLSIVQMLATNSLLFQTD